MSRQTNKDSQPPAPASSSSTPTILRLLPTILVVLLAGYLVSKMMPRAIPGPMNLSAAAKISVVHEGRVMPLDSLARNELLINSKKTTWRSDWLRPAQLRDHAGLAKAIVEQAKANAASPAGRILALCTEEERKTLAAIAQAPVATEQMQADLLELLNRVIDDERRPAKQVHDEKHDHAHDVPVRLYTSEEWKGVELPEEMKSSVAKLMEWDRRDPHADKPMRRPLTGPQVIELNRRLLSVAFPQQVRAMSAAQEPAITWLMDVFADQRRANSHRIFRIEHDRILELLGLEHRPGNLRYAVDEFLPRMKELDREANLARRTPSKERDAYESGLIDLAGNLTRFMQLAQFQKPHWIPPAKLDSTWRNFEEIAAESRRTGVPNEDAQNVLTMLTAYTNGDVQLFNDAVKRHNERVRLGFASDVARTDFETFFNRFDLFSHVTNFYLVVFLIVLLSWLFYRNAPLADALRRSAFWMLALLVVVHAIGMFSRMYLMQRPLVFVTNLYASAVFIGLTAIIVALLIEKVQRMGFGSAVAASIGFITGIIALHLRGEGDTLEMQQAVLDTNFWLATHVTTITFGYAATYLAGAFGIAFVLAGLFTKALAQVNTRSGSLTHAAAMSGVSTKAALIEAATVKGEPVHKTFGRIIYGVTCFALFLSFVGTVLGGIWADQSWGRFWGWDPKENGALMIVIWCALILHARWAGMVQARGMAVLAILGNIVTTWSWFGTNQLGAGLHSYGFMDKAVFWILVFSASQLILAGIGMLPMQAWRSFRDDKGHGHESKGGFIGAVTAATLLILVGGIALGAVLL